MVWGSYGVDHIMLVNFFLSNSMRLLIFEKIDVYEGIDEDL
jgi:hypothetical protein